MQLQRITPTPNRTAPWRERWHSSNVQVWGRLADEPEDCEAIRWLHGSYQEAVPSARIAEGSIYRSSVTGQVGQIGRLWHRMYPLVRLVKNPDDPKGRPIPKQTQQYFELLTIFPDASMESTQLMVWLENHPKPLFQKLWSVTQP